MESVLEQIYACQDEGYGVFQRRLLPTVAPEKIIGVRTPCLRQIARTMVKEGTCEGFLAELPHTFFEENQLHGFILSEIQDFEQCMGELERFLPCIDNWATCDQTSPKIFRKHKEKLLPYIRKWLKAEHTYTVRFAIGMLMQHFLEADFKPEYLNLVTSIRSEEYYVRMEIAWFMATALAKQWEAAIPCIQQQTMDKWTHNRTIQKARESFRITPEQKACLKTLVIK